MMAKVIVFIMSSLVMFASMVRAAPAKVPMAVVWGMLVCVCDIYMFTNSIGFTLLALISKGRVLSRFSLRSGFQSITVKAIL
jgi:hypothetical protein